MKSAKGDSRAVYIISHGPACLDGTVAAAAIARFHSQTRISPCFATNSDADRMIQSLEPTADRETELWITDLSWREHTTADHLNRLAVRGVQIFWIDHHRSAVARAGAPEFQVAFAGRVLTEVRSAAWLTYEYLEQHRSLRCAPADQAGWREFSRVVELADDNDRWIHRFPESREWALAVQTLGAHEAFRTLVRLKRPLLTRKLKEAAARGREAMLASLTRARATCIESPLRDGYTLLAACCTGYSSEVAYELYRTRQRTVVALFDLRSGGVSLRRSPDASVDLSSLAAAFGGGGHAAAAGFAMDDLLEASLRRLVERIRSQFPATVAT